MYLSYKAFSGCGIADMSEAEYRKASCIADAVIDDWTLGRVGRAYRDGMELPPSVKALYCAIVEAVPTILEGSKVGKGGLVSSFSNGVDSFSFDVTDTMGQRLHRQLGWMLDLLPVEWSSRVASYEGGPHHVC